MRIAFNALSAQAGGGISALVNLGPTIARLDSSNEYLVFVCTRQREILEHLRGRVRVVRVSGIFRGTLLRMLWEQFVLPFHLLMKRVDILYSTGNVTSLAAPCRVLLLLENSNPYSRLPIDWTRKERMRSLGLRALGWLSARRAQRVRFLSDNSRTRLESRLHLPRSKCITIPHGFAKTMTGAKGGQCDGPFILTVSVVAPHKNVEVLIRAFAILIEWSVYTGRLAIVGDCCYPHYARRLQGLVQNLSMKGRVLFGGSVPHARIGGWYEAADMYVQTSVEETFGMPVLEALAYGKRVIAPALGGAEGESLFLPYAELFGDSCRYYDPFDHEALARTMQRALGDDAFRRRAIADGELVAMRYSWENTAVQLIRTFREMRGAVDA